MVILVVKYIRRSHCGNTSLPVQLTDVASLQPQALNSPTKISFTNVCTSIGMADHCIEVSHYVEDWSMMYSRPVSANRSVLLRFSRSWSHRFVECPPRPESYYDWHTWTTHSRCCVCPRVRRARIQVRSLSAPHCWWVGCIFSGLQSRSIKEGSYTSIS